MRPVAEPAPEITLDSPLLGELAVQRARGPRG